MGSPPLGKPNITSNGISSLISSATALHPSTSALAVTPNGSPAGSWMATLTQTLLGLAKLIPALLLCIITFTTITLPTLLFTLFSTSLTFTMNATTLWVACEPSQYCIPLTLVRLLIVLAFASTISWIVRYRYLNMYARLPPEPQRKEPQIDLFPDMQERDSKPGLANYLDEFLSAIKVFGYRK